MEHKRRAHGIGYGTADPANYSTNKKGIGVISAGNMQRLLAFPNLAISAVEMLCKCVNSARTAFQPVLGSKVSDIRKESLNFFLQNKPNFKKAFTYGTWGRHSSPVSVAQEQVGDAGLYRSFTKLVPLLLNLEPQQALAIKYLLNDSGGTNDSKSGQ